MAPAVTVFVSAGAEYIGGPNEGQGQRSSVKHEHHQSTLEKWSHWFEGATEALEGADFEAVGATLATQSAEGLKGYLRHVLRRAGVQQSDPTPAVFRETDKAQLDPWRIEVAVRRSGHFGAIGRPPAGPLWKFQPRFGVVEPDLHVRVWALCHRQLAEFAGHTRTTTTDPTPDPMPDGSAEVRWWLTGAEPDWKNEGQALNGVEVARQVALSLRGLSLLSPRSLARREDVLDQWSSRVGSRDVPEDRLVRDFLGHWADTTALRGQALAIAKGFISARQDPKRLEAALRSFLSDRFYDEPPTHPVASAAYWCGRVTAIGLASVPEVERDEIRKYRRQLLEGLVEEGEGLLPRAPFSLSSDPIGFIVWRSLTVLLRVCLRDARQVETARLLHLVAESGSWTRNRSKEVLRIGRLLRAPSGLGDSICREMATGTVMRLAMTTCQQRARTARQMWRKTLKRYVQGGRGQPEVAVMHHWWGDVQEPQNEGRWLESLKIVSYLAGTDFECETNSDEQRVAFWHRAQAQLAGSDANPPAIVGLELAEPQVATGRGTSGRALIHIDYRVDRYGEVTVSLNAYGQGDGALTNELSSGYYNRPVPKTDIVADLNEALKMLNVDATAGKLRGAVAAQRVNGVVNALSRLAPRPFWTELAPTLEGRSAELLVADDFGVPWELMPSDIKDTPLGLNVPLVRARPGRRGAPKPPMRLLLLCDRSHEGVEDEIAALAAVWPRAVRMVATRADYDAIETSDAFDIVHYAGHRCVARDGTPALKLRGGRVPIAELSDRFYNEPPQLLFLNACATLSASRVSRLDDGAGHLQFGTLEPLLKTPIRAFVGTLWDVKPPDQTFVETFYASIASGESIGRALLDARRRVWTLPSWEGTREAYVALASG